MVIEDLLKEQSKHVLALCSELQTCREIDWENIGDVDEWTALLRRLEHCARNGAEVAYKFELTTLARCCSISEENFALLATPTCASETMDWQLVAVWTEIAHTCFRSLLDCDFTVGMQERLVDHMADPRWPLAIEHSERHVLLASLRESAWEGCLPGLSSADVPEDDVFDWVLEDHQKTLACHELLDVHPSDAIKDPQVQTDDQSEIPILSDVFQVVRSDEEPRTKKVSAVDHASMTGNADLEKMAWTGAECQRGYGYALHRAHLLCESMSAAQRYHRQLQVLGAELRCLNGFVPPETVISEAGIDALVHSSVSDIHANTLKLMGEVNTIASQAEMALDKAQQELKELRRIVSSQQKLGLSQQKFLNSLTVKSISEYRQEFQNLVTRAAQEAEKKVDLQIHGAELMVDSSLFNSLIPLLKSLLRAIVLESMDCSSARLRASKPRIGCIKLCFSKSAGDLVVQCSNDGCAIECTEIFAVAHEFGLNDTLKEHMSELDHLWSSPAFAARMASSRSHGFGAALGEASLWVHRRVGKVVVKSEEEAGTRITLFIPSGEAFVDIFTADVGGRSLHVLCSGVERVVPLLAEHLKTARGNRCYALDENDLLPVFSLSALLNENSQATLGQERYLMILNGADGKIGVAVESVKRSSEQMKLSLPNYSSRIRGLVGVTIAEDGGVAAVYDLCQLLPKRSSAEQKQPSLSESNVSEQLSMVEPSLSPRPKVLVVDTLSSSRKRLGEFVRRLGAEVSVAKDGVEAMQVLQRESPSLILTDLQMPRMGGLELVRLLRLGTGTESIPVIVITAQSNDRERRRAEQMGVDAYVLKPWNESDLEVKIRACLEGATTTES